VTLEGQTMEERVEEIVSDLLRDRFQLPLRRKIVSEDHCEMCGAPHAQNFDYLDKPNGYHTHPVGICIHNLRERIDGLQQRLEDVSAPKR